MVLQGSCQLLHVQAAIRLMRTFVMKRVLLRMPAFVAKRVSLQIRAFLGLFGADFYTDTGVSKSSKNGVFYKSSYLRFEFLLGM